MSSEDWTVKSCVFCLKPVKDPMLLVCDHNICSSCLEEAMLFSEAILSFSGKDDKDTESCVSCPLCGSKTKQSEVKPNLVLRALASSEAQIAEAAEKKLVCGFCQEPATKICPFCGALCDKHSEFLHVNGPMKTHEVAKIEPGKKPQLDWNGSSSNGQTLPMCFTHKKRCELVCQVCNTLVCPHCVFIGDHKGHACVGVHDLFKKMTPTILKLADSIREAIPSCEALLHGFECLEKDSDTSRKELQDQVNKTFSEYQATLEKKRKDVLQDIDDIFDDFTQTVERRKKALTTLHSRCEDYLSRVAKEESLPRNVVARYALFHMLNELNEALKVVSNTRPPDENSKICRVVYKKDFENPNFSPASALRLFRLGCGKRQAVAINMAALSGTHSFDSAISANQESSHDGAAFYDPVRNCIFAVGGNVNNCRDVLVTRLTDATHGETTRRADVVPFSSHGQYPIFDGTNYAYFCESEGEDEDTRFGRLNLDTMTFEELARPEESFREFNSGCYANGRVYVICADNLMEYDPGANRWTNTGMEFEDDCRLLPDPLSEGDTFYCLYAGVRGLYQVNVHDHTTALVSNAPRDFDLNQNGEALIVALPDMTRVLFTSLSDHWFYFSFDDQRWVELPEWSNTHNGSAHLVVVPSGPVALYHIDGNPRWTGVNLS